MNLIISDCKETNLHGQCSPSSYTKFIDDLNMKPASVRYNRRKEGVVHTLLAMISDRRCIRSKVVGKDEATLENSNRGALNGLILGYAKGNWWGVLIYLLNTLQIVKNTLYYAFEGLFRGQGQRKNKMSLYGVRIAEVDQELRFETSLQGLLP